MEYKFSFSVCAWDSIDTCCLFTSTNKHIQTFENNLKFISILIWMFFFKSGGFN